jgi:hypothetical protein
VLLQKQRELLARAIAGRSLDIPLRPPFNLNLQVYQVDQPNGKPTGPMMYKDNDLILDNFGLFMASFIAAYTGAASLSVPVTLKDTGGANRTVSVWNATASTIATSSYLQNVGCLIGVGTGTTPAARGDPNLETQVGSWTPLGGNSTWTSGAGTVTFAGSVLIAGGATVTEAGLEIILRDTGNVIRNVLFLHDVFDGVPVGVGKYAHVAYTLQL